MTDGTTPPLLPNSDEQEEKPVYKRWWFIAIAVILGLGLIGSIGEEGDGSEAEATATTTTSEPTDTTTNDFVTTTTVPPTTTTTEAPTTTVAPAPDSESVDLDVSPDELPESVTSELFVILIRDESSDLPLNWTDIWSDDELNDFAQTICNGWDDGLTFEGLALAGVTVLIDEGWDSDTDYEMLGYVIGVATEAFCPEHSDKIG